MKKYNVFRWWLIPLVFICSFPLLHGQKDRQDLETQRKALEKQIQHTSDILKRTQKDKSKSLGQLKTLNAQIRQRQDLLESIQEEIRAVETEASVQEKSKKETEQQITSLEDRLQHALRMAYVRTQLQPEWMYLLNAGSLGQVFVRWVYLRRYKSYVVSQLQLLTQKREAHRHLILQLEANKESKTVLLKVEEKNKRAIQTEQRSKEAMVRDLGKEEKKLKNQLAATQEKKKKLDEEIARLIRAESNKMNTAGLTDAPETKALNDQFSANKGKLPWPVSKGLVTEKFGTHPHPVLKGITVQNNGIDIQSESGSAVKSLFNGVVASVTKIPGYDYMVMVRHGLYFTVYSRLQQVAVKKGDTVSTGQVLGQLGSDDPELHLEIWQDKSKLNPETWMARR